MSTVLDTSVIVAALLGWHEHHEAARPAIESVIGSGDRLVLPVPVLFESYAVMTRLPAPHRVRAEDAFRLLERSFRASADLVGLSGAQVWEVVRELVADGVTGGRSYDAHVVACARSAGASRIVTLNRRDFEAVASPDIEVVCPI